MLDFETGTSFGILVSVTSMSAFPYKLNGFTKEGPFEFDFTPLGTGVNESFSFGMTDIPIMLSLCAVTNAEVRNKVFATIFLTINGSRNVLLASGHPNGKNGITWPISSPIIELQKKGFWNTTTGADPAAGAEINTAIPNRKVWRLRSVEFTLVTAAVAANRNVSLLIKPLNGGIITIPTATTQIISETKKYIFYEGASLINNVTGNTIVTPLPQDLWLPATSVIATLTAGLDAGDNFGAPIYNYEEHVISSSA